MTLCSQTGSFWDAQTGSRHQVAKLYQTLRCPIQHPPICAPRQDINMHPMRFFSNTNCVYNEIAIFVKRTVKMCAKLPRMGYDKRIGSSYHDAGLGGAEAVSPKMLKRLRTWQCAWHTSPGYYRQSWKSTEQRRNVIFKLRKALVVWMQKSLVFGSIFQTQHRKKKKMISESPCLSHSSPSK